MSYPKWRFVHKYKKYIHILKFINLYTSYLNLYTIKKFKHYNLASEKLNGFEKQRDL